MTFKQPDKKFITLDQSHPAWYSDDGVKVVPLAWIRISDDCNQILRLQIHDYIARGMVKVQAAMTEEEVAWRIMTAK